MLAKGPDASVAVENFRATRVSILRSRSHTAESIKVDPADS